MVKNAVLRTPRGVFPRPSKGEGRGGERRGRDEGNGEGKRGGRVKDGKGGKGKGRGREEREGRRAGRGWPLQHHSSPMLTLNACVASFDELM